MRNGVGLASARGSGTSGYVQTNKFHRDASRLTRDAKTNEGWRARDRDGGAGATTTRRPSAAILEHNALRAIEVACAELEERMASEGASEGAIEAAIEKTRRDGRDALRRRRETATKAKSEARDESTHGVMQRKEEEMERLARAFGVDKRERDAREGDAFDRELQQTLREEKRAAREEEERRRARERRRAEKREKKAKKRAKKREKRERKERERREKSKRRGEREAEDAKRNAARFREELDVVDAEIKRRGLDPNARPSAVVDERRRVDVPPPPSQRVAEVPPPPPQRRVAEVPPPPPRQVDVPPPPRGRSRERDSSRSRSYSRSSSYSSSDSRSRSPPRRRRDSRSRSPPRRRRDSRSDSRTRRRRRDDSSSRSRSSSGTSSRSRSPKRRRDEGGRRHDSDSD
jgi:serine/arginine repetitive matrix protein 2